jgi:hypothetical protein
MREQSRWKPFAQTNAGRAVDGLKLGSESHTGRGHSNGLTFILKSALDRGVPRARSQNYSLAFAAAARNTSSTNVRSCLPQAALSYDTQSNRDPRNWYSGFRDVRHQSLDVRGLSKSMIRGTNRNRVGAKWFGISEPCRDFSENAGACALRRRLNEC